MYQLPSWVDHVVVVGCWLSSVLFAVLYTLKAPWWSTRMGQNIFFFDLAVAGALTPGIMKYLFNVDPAGEFYQWFLVGDLIAVAMLVLHRTYLLMKVQDGWNWNPAAWLLARWRSRRDS